MNQVSDWAGLGIFLRARRKEMRLSQPAVAAAGGPSPATLRKLENDRARSISPSKARDLERVLGLPPRTIDAVLNRETKAAAATGAAGRWTGIEARLDRIIQLLESQTPSPANPLSEVLPPPARHVTSVAGGVSFP